MPHGWARGAALTAGKGCSTSPEWLRVGPFTQDRGKPLLEASVLLKSSLAAAAATCEFTSSLLLSKKKICFCTFQTIFSAFFSFKKSVISFRQIPFFFLRNMRKISKIKSCLQNVLVKYKAFLLFVFLSPPFGRRESRITLCQPEKYFLCLSSPSSKPKIINYSHSFGLLLFDCGLFLWRAFRNVPPGKFGLCGSRCCFSGADSPDALTCLGSGFLLFLFPAWHCCHWTRVGIWWFGGCGSVVSPSKVVSCKEENDF